MTGLGNWVYHYAKNETEWKDKNGDTWSINERIIQGGGVPIPPPDFNKGFSDLIETFFHCRGFLKGYDEPLTPMVVNSIGEYVPDVYRDILWHMDKRYRAGMADAAEFWEGK
ncbi:hypothetical protein [Phaeobacter italicus]|jgi:hypothetical protein|uniref:hypothetical protein n=1 Tax=Phaeobacter italicus TaxID=481446 RepID=UPI002FDE78C1